MVNRVIRDIPISRKTRNNSSVSCCCFNLNKQFLTSQRGILKISQVFIGGLAQSFLINYGAGVALLLGNAYTAFLTNASSFIFTSSLLIFCYLVSENSERLIGKSIFEIALNVTAAWLYVGSSVYLFLMTSLVLWPLYLVTPFFQAYPALTAASSLGLFLALLHAVDAYFALKRYRGR